MRNLLNTAVHAFILASLILTTFATPAQARHGDDDYRYSRNDDWRDSSRYQNNNLERHHRDRRYHRYLHERNINQNVIIINRPRVVREDDYIPRRRSAYTRPREVLVVPDEQYTETRVSCTGGNNLLPAIAGTLAGGAIGSTIGNGRGNDVAIIAGALLGGAVGSSYTYGDRYCTQQVLESTEIGRPVSWRNYDTGYDYTVTPTRDYRTEGRYCREYQARADVAGRTQETYGTACMQPDGSWEIVK